MSNQIRGTGSEGMGGAEHVDIEGPLAYAHGETDGAEADAVLQHSRACRECGDELAVMLALAGTGVVALDRDESATPEASRRWIGLVAASVVFAALLGAIVLSGWLRPGGPLPDEGVARLATTQAPSRLMLDFLFSTETSVDNRARARGGFALIVDGRYDDAVAQLSTLYDAQPGDGEVAMSLGIALYLAGDDSDRVEALLTQGRALRPQDFSNLSGWYLGNHFLRRGHLVQAIVVLEELVSPQPPDPDESGTQARELLERLRSEIR
jgi:hypothetical protein